MTESQLGIVLKSHLAKTEYEATFGVADMKVSRILIFSLVLGTLLMAVSSIRSESEVGADLEVVSYGFPLFWLFHQVLSIAGPVDVWSIELPILVVNFVIWWVISIAIVFAWRKLRVS